MPSDSGCTFCDIVSGKGTSHKVFEDQHSLAFMDIYPASDGHILVISKTHWESVFEIDSDAIKAVADTSRKVALAIQKTLSPDGMSIVQANGEAAGQTVMHYHWHLLPRTVGHKMRLYGPRQATPERLDELARSIIANL